MKTVVVKYVRENVKMVGYGYIHNGIVNKLNMFSKKNYNLMMIAIKMIVGVKTIVSYLVVLYILLVI